MAENQKDRYIQYLAEQNQDLLLTSDAMKLVLENFMAQTDKFRKQLFSSMRMARAVVSYLQFFGRCRVEEYYI